MILLSCFFCTRLIPSGCYCSHNSIPDLQHTMYYKTIHFTLYFVGSIPYKAATFPCLNLFDGFQALFRLSFEIRGEVYKSSQFDSSLPTRLHLPLHLLWVTSLWPFGSSLNLWKKPSSFPSQVFDSCCSGSGVLPFLLTLSSISYLTFKMSLCQRSYREAIFHFSAILPPFISISHSPLSLLLLITQFTFSH